MKVKADGVAEKVPAAVKEPHPGPARSSGELPGLVACHEISSEGGKGKPGDREETGERLSAQVGKHSPSQNWV